MKLLTKKIIDNFKKTGSQENIKDPIVIAKFFNPTGNGHWWATEYNETTKCFFGYAQLFYEQGMDEWGEFSLQELEEFKGRFGLGIERDLHFTPKPISECGITTL